MAAERDPQETAVEMLRAVASSGFGIINAIQAQSAAVDDLVSMAKRNTHISADEVQNTLDLLQLAKDELANAYDLALEATIATWSVTEVPGGVYLPSGEPDDSHPSQGPGATSAPGPGTTSAPGPGSISTSDPGTTSAPGADDSDPGDADH
ncbi:MAG: hypothetical protein ACRDUA_05750 [Micromonosporaceae bacterium]